MAQKQAQANAQGNGQGNTSAQNVASKATQGGANSDIITAEEQKAIDNIKKLHDETEQAFKELQVYSMDLSISAWDPEYRKATQKYLNAKKEEEKARDEATAKGVPFVSRDWLRLDSHISKRNVQTVPVSKHGAQPSEQEIIDRIAGGDKTKKGSCASVAFAYIANKCGLDALDFRGGNSRDMFAKKDIKALIMRLPGIKGREELIDKTPAKSGANILLGLEKGKEYYLSFAEHAAIVKNTESGVKCLELQAPDAQDNGWHLMGNNTQDVANTLAWRFRAKKRMTSLFPEPLRLLDVDSFKGSREFEKVTEYFNTNFADQQKGARGSVK